MTNEEFRALCEALVSMRDELSDEVALTVPKIFPNWIAEGHEYSVGDKVLYEGTLYKVLQAHTSQSAWNPVDAVSLFAEVLIPDPEVIPEWVQPDSTNPYMVGDKVTHNGKTWVSLIDNNVWEPGAVGTEALWEEVVG